MVTISEAKNLIQQKRQQLESTRSQIEQQRLRDLTTRQIRFQTPTSLAKRRTESMTFTEEKKSALARLKPVEQQILAQEQQVKDIESQIQQRENLISQLQRAETLGKKFADKPEFFKFLPKDIRKIAKNEAERNRAIQEFKQQITELKAQEVTIPQLQPVKTTSSGYDLFVKPLLDKRMSIKPEKKETIGDIALKWVGEKTGLFEAEKLKRDIDTKFENIFSKIPGGEKILSVTSGKDPLQLTQEGFDWGAKQFISASQKLGKKTGFESALSGTFLDIRVPTSSAETFTSNVFKGIFFSPAFATGVISKETSAQLSKELSKSKFDKLKKLMDDLVNEIKSKSSRVEQEKVLKKVFDALKTQEQRENFKTFVKELQNQGILKEKIIKIEDLTSAVSRTSPEVTFQLNIQGTLPQMKGAGAITGTTSKIGNIFLNKESSKLFEQSKSNQKLLLGLKTDTQTKQKTILSWGQPQKTLQEPRQIPRTKQTTTTILGSASGFFFPQPQIPRQIPKQKPRLKPRITPRLKPRIPKKVPLPKGVAETATLRKLMALYKKRQGVNVEVGMKLGKRKTIARNIPPFRALRKAQKYVDRFIDASFRITKSGKTTRKKDISPFNVSHRFRPSKTNPLFVVEKRKYRISSKEEKQALKKSKKLKKKLFSFK